MKNTYKVNHVSGATLYTQETYQEYLSALLNRRSMGRYTLDEAALAVEQSTTEPARDVLNKLMQAAYDGSLPIHRPDQQTMRLPEKINALYDEAYAADLNQWLAQNESRLANIFRFPLLANEITHATTTQAKLGHSHKKGSDWTDDELQELLRSYKAGKTQEALGKQHNLSQRRISMLLKTAVDKFEKKTRTSDSRLPFSTLVQFWNR